MRSSTAGSVGVTVCCGNPFTRCSPNVRAEIGSACATTSPPLRAETLVLPSAKRSNPITAQPCASAAPRASPSTVICAPGNVRQSAMPPCTNAPSQRSESDVGAGAKVGGGGVGAGIATTGGVATGGASACGAGGCAAAHAVIASVNTSAQTPPLPARGGGRGWGESRRSVLRTIARKRCISGRRRASPRPLPPPLNGRGNVARAITSSPDAFRASAASLPRARDRLPGDRRSNI